MGKIRKTPSAKVRFAKKLTRTDNGCLIWTGAVGSHGYGNFWDGENHILAHVFAYEQHNGKIETKGKLGSVVMHNCPNGDNRLCCEPSHLIIGTHRANLLDTIRKGRLTRDIRTGRMKGGIGQVAT